jgi:hypothetical protein
MASMAPAAQASRRIGPWRRVIDRAAVGNIGAPSGFSVWESRVTGRQGSKQEGPGRLWHAQAHAVAEDAGRGRMITGKNSAERGSTALKKG